MTNMSVHAHYIVIWFDSFMVLKWLSRTLLRLLYFSVEYLGLLRQNLILECLHWTFIAGLHVGFEDIDHLLVGKCLMLVGSRLLLLNALMWLVLNVQWGTVPSLLKYGFFQTALFNWCLLLVKVQLGLCSYSWNVRLSLHRWLLLGVILWHRFLILRVGTLVMTGTHSSLATLGTILRALQVVHFIRLIGLVNWLIATLRLIWWHKEIGRSITSYVFNTYILGSLSHVSRLADFSIILLF